MQNLVFNEQGLIPAIVQDAATGVVLMQAWMNAEAIEKTRATGRVTFFSRSRNELWTKGETSGNYLIFKEMLADCDRDCLLIKADPMGPACHTGADTCWSENNHRSPKTRPETSRPEANHPETNPETSRSEATRPKTESPEKNPEKSFLFYLEEYLHTRRNDPPEVSYTARLLSRGINKVAQKVGEEAVELVIEAKDANDDLFLGEAADLMYHYIVLLMAKGFTLDDVAEVLRGRHK